MNNVSRVSPLAIAFIIMSIFMSIVPPISIILIVFAITTQLKMNRRRRRVRNARIVSADRRRHTEMLVAARHFSAIR